MPVHATAVERGLPVVTQDHDYSQIAAALPELDVVTV